jgi:hypothetical protein
LLEPGDTGQALANFKKTFEVDGTLAGLKEQIEGMKAREHPKSKRT